MMKAVKENSWDIEKIARKRKARVFYGTVQYLGIYALAAEFNIPISVALARHELGWRVEDLVEKPWGDKGDFILPNEKTKKRLRAWRKRRESGIEENHQEG